MKKLSVIFLSFLLIISIFCTYCAADSIIEPDDDASGDESTEAGGAIPPLEVDATGACLMEANTGTVLFSQNAEEAVAPASVTKIMTLLLVMEALDSGAVTLEDKVTVSANAASMGGSQVFLEEGEQMTLDDLLKCTVIASANDAAVALAEYVMGSEEAFVARMNERAQELGATTAVFENATGLDDDVTCHVMSAMDVALISRALISHRKILEYASVWMDTIRDGAFTLTNTNRLIRYYDGATGLKTGSTDKAKFCITATADKNGMELIAVIMGAPSRDSRNASAKMLFDWGYANYALYTDPAVSCGEIDVVRGLKDSVPTTSTPISIVLPKAKVGEVARNVSMNGALTGPVSKGDEVGSVTYTLDGEVVGVAPICAEENVEGLSFWSFAYRMFKIFILS